MSENLSRALVAFGAAVIAGTIAHYGWNDATMPTWPFYFGIFIIGLPILFGKG